MFFMISYFRVMVIFNLAYRFNFAQVRVPLNTARAYHYTGREHNSSISVKVLAVQNMEASGTVAKAQEIEFKALEGSLNMMSKGKSSTSPTRPPAYILRSAQRRARLVNVLLFTSIFQPHRII